MRYYSALRFSERPELHMTLLPPEPMGVDTLMRFLRSVNTGIWLREPAQFVLRCDNVRWFGAGRRTRVLTTSQRMPEWLAHFTKKGWTPHVSCMDDNLILRADQISIMSKQNVVYTWELRDER